MKDRIFLQSLQVYCSYQNFIGYNLEHSIGTVDVAAAITSWQA